MNLLSGLTGLYMLLIFIRVMLTWFSGVRYGRPVEILGVITDPYLNWWRRFPVLRSGMFDLSPIAAMAVLSLAQNVFSTIALYGRVSLGVILAITLQSVWSAASFILGFFLIVVILRLIAYLTNRDTYGTFWRIVDAVSQPVLYRITRIFYRNKPVNYMTSIVLSMAALLILSIGGYVLVKAASGLLLGLPV
jgi:YggT family protein